MASNPVIEEIPPSTADKAAIAAESNTTGSNSIESDPTESDPTESSPSPEAVVLEDMPSDDDTGPADDEAEDLPAADTPSGQGIGAPLEFKYSTNSADAVKLTWEADNLTGKRINYYTAHISTFNPVGDPSNDQLNGKSSFSLKYVYRLSPMILYLFSVILHIRIQYIRLLLTSSHFNMMMVLSRPSTMVTKLPMIAVYNPYDLQPWCEPELFARHNELMVM